MRTRKVKDIEKALTKKGFIIDEDKHHRYLYFYYQGKKTTVYTYLSHGKGGKDYSSDLMSKVKKQLKFQDSSRAEDFFDCPMTEIQYIEMLQKLEEI